MGYCYCWDLFMSLISRSVWISCSFPKATVLTACSPLEAGLCKLPVLLCSEPPDFLWSMLFWAPCSLLVSALFIPLFSLSNWLYRSISALCSCTCSDYLSIIACIFSFSFFIVRYSPRVTVSSSFARSTSLFILSLSAAACLPSSTFSSSSAF